MWSDDSFATLALRPGKMTGRGASSQGCSLPTPYAIPTPPPGNGPRLGADWDGASGGGATGGRVRKLDDERGAALRAVPRAQTAVVLLDDAVRDPETEPRPFAG